MIKLEETTPSKPIKALPLLVAIILGGLVYTIGSVQDWSKNLEYIRDGVQNTYQEVPDPVIGTGCDCLTPGASGYHVDNNYCSGSVFSDQIVHNGETHSYTANFDSSSQDAYCGQFFSGTYWVAPSNFASVQLTQFTGTSTGGTTDLFISDENPSLESNGYLEPRASRDYGNFNAAEIVLYPSSYSTSVSLVGSLQSSPGETCGTVSIEGLCMRSFYTATVLQEPLVDSHEHIRPSAYGTVKEATPIVNFDFSIWPSISFFTGTDAAGMQAMIDKWRFHTDVFGVGAANGDTFSEGGRAFRSDYLSDDYSAGSAQQWNTDIKTLMSDDNPMDDLKKKTIVTLLLVGKDMFSMIYDDNGSVMLKDRQYMSGAGQWLGKLGPMALYAAMTNEQRYKDALQRVPTDYLDNNSAGPQELQQVNIAISANGYVWGDTQIDLTADPQTYVHGYWQGLQGMKCFNGAWDIPVADWFFNGCPIDESGEVAIPSQIGGKKTIGDPHRYIDGNEMYPGLLYPQNHAGVAGSLAAFAMLMPEVEDVINYDGLIIYSRRYRNEGIAVMNDSCAPPDAYDFCKEADTTDPTHGVCFGLDHTEFFDDCQPTKVVSTGAKCGYYGPTALIDGSLTTATWGPEPTDPTFQSCIQNSTTWEWNGSSWSTRPAVMGERNFGQTGRFSERPNPNPMIQNRVLEIEDNWALIEAIYDTP